MTKILLEQITNIEDIAIFSKAYQEGLIQIKILRQETFSSTKSTVI